MLSAEYPIILNSMLLCLKIKLGKGGTNWDSIVLFYRLVEKKRSGMGAGSSFKFDPWL